MTSEPSSLLRLGEYELVRPLAHGGMADIYLARRAGGEHERHLAVKVLNHERAADAESRALFMDEGRLVQLLDHDNIARVLQVDIIDGHHFLAMEYVHGCDLRECVNAATHEGRVIPYETAISIVSAAATGLDHAHRRCDSDGQPLRLVHRDVSLSNIMIGHDGSVKVVDFGIAQTTLSSVHTSPGVVRGKASYMSPEQCLGDEVDLRTDVFALGVVLYELTTGSRCFHGKSDFERMLAVVRGDYLKPGEIVADYPVELEQVVGKAMAPDISQRYQSCAALIEALERVAIARMWIGGGSAIVRLMRELFGEVPEPWATPVGDRTEPSFALPEPLPENALEADETSDAPIEPPVTSPTLSRPRRFPKGTLADVFTNEQWQANDDDQPTRGRRSVPRLPPNVAA
jgi:eukaryotic-like serine/threonine-protein kinase